MALSLELFDETLDINATSNYELSVQVSPDGFAFTLLDSIRNKFVLLRSFTPEDDKKFKTEQIDDIIKKDDFLHRTFKSIKVVLPSAKCTLVPSPLFDPAHRDEYFLFNHLPVENNIILNNNVVNHEAYIVFSISNSLNELINNKFPSATIVHHLKPLIVNAPVNRIGHTEKYIQLHVEKGFFNLIYFKEKKLKFCNTFTYRNISDILYFVMYTFNNMGIKQDEPLILSGLAEPFGELHTSISEYVKTVKFAVPAGTGTYSYVFNEVSLHKFINLFNATNCE